MAQPYTRDKVFTTIAAKRIAGAGVRIGSFNGMLESTSRGWQKRRTLVNAYAGAAATTELVFGQQ
jgi:hypothetical protein